MRKYKSFVLPVALVAGYFLRTICAVLSVAVPYVIFCILLLTFSGVRLSRLRPSVLDLYLVIFQAVVSIAGYSVLMAFTGNELVSEGMLMCVLCPVASSVTVVATMLGADAVRTTAYTIIGNLMVAIVAPVYFSLIDSGVDVSFLDSATRIFIKVASVIALPFFVMLFVQRFFPGVNAVVSRYKGFSFYLWAFALFVTIGQTADFVVMRWNGNESSVAWLALVSLAVCVVQFTVGRRFGAMVGDRIAGGQLLAQKNSAIGIWMTNSFLDPLASVALAFYSIWQNIFNSWQIYRRGRTVERPRR